MTSATVINLGFDPGNGAIKVKSDSGRYSTASIISTSGMTSNQIRLNVGDQDIAFSHGYASRESSVQTGQSRRYKAERLQQLYAIALSILPEISVGSYHVNLVVSSPYESSEDDQLFAEKLAEDISLQTNTQRATVTTEVHAVRREGWGVIGCKSFENSEGQAILNLRDKPVTVVELGCGTVNVSTYAQGQKMQFTTDHHGVFSLAEIVAKLASSAHKTRFDAYEVMQAMQSVKQLKSVDGYNLAPQYKQAVSMWRDGGLAAVLGDAAHAADSRPVVWAGGGVLLPGMSKALLKKHPNFYVPYRAEDPEFAKFAHVEGLYRRCVAVSEQNIRVA